MGRIGIRELKQNASAVIRRVAAGESLEVTDRGRPVARLVPLESRSRLQELVASGRATAPLADDRTHLLAPPLPARPGAPSLSEILERMRADER